MGGSHVAGSRIPHKEGYGGKPDWKGTPGETKMTKTRWFVTAKRDLSKINNTFSIDLATDQWKRIVETAKDLNGSD